MLKLTVLQPRVRCQVPDWSPRDGTLSPQADIKASHMENWWCGKWLWEGGQSRVLTTVDSPDVGPATLLSSGESN